ncbi:hypothetical protein GIB67_024903, partial [Kingdonia uniflora]
MLYVLGSFLFLQKMAQMSAHSTFTCLPRTRWQRSGHGDQQFWPTCITIWVYHLEMMGGNLHAVPPYSSHGSLHIFQSLLGSPRRWTLTYMSTVLVKNGTYLLRIDTVGAEGTLVCIEGYLEWFASVSWITICPTTIDLVADDDVRIHQRKDASVNEHDDTPVHQYKDVVEQYDVSYYAHTSLSPNAHGTMQIRGGSCDFDQQITTLNDQLQKLKEDKKESEANINLKEALKEKTSECDLLKETIEQMKKDIELKRVVDKQYALEFTDLPRQLDAKILEYKNLEEKNTSLEAELRQKSGLEDWNQSLSIKLNKNCKDSESLKAVNAPLMEQMDLQLSPPTSPVPDATLAKKYENLLAAHEDVMKKLITKEDFISLFNARFEVTVVEIDDYQLHIVEFDNIVIAGGDLASSIEE